MPKKKYLQALEVNMPSIGTMVKGHLKKNKIKMAEVARKMNRTPITFSDYTKNVSIQTAILWEISHAIQHNFFADLAQQMPVHFSSNVMPDNTLQNKMTALETELHTVKAERDILLKAISK